MNICHKPSQQRSTAQKWQIYLWMSWRGFLPLPTFSFQVCCCWSGLPCPAADCARTRVSGFAPAEGSCSNGGLGTGRGHHQQGCLHRDRVEHFYCLNTAECIRQSFIFHLVQQAVTYLSPGHRCPTPPDASHGGES